MVSCISSLAALHIPPGIMLDPCKRRNGETWNDSIVVSLAPVPFFLLAGETRRLIPPLPPNRPCTRAETKFPCACARPCPSGRVFPDPREPHEEWRPVRRC